MSHMIHCVCNSLLCPNSKYSIHNTVYVRMQWPKFIDIAKKFGDHSESAYNQILSTLSAAWCRDEKKGRKREKTESFLVVACSSIRIPVFVHKHIRMKTKRTKQREQATEAH